MVLFSPNIDIPERLFRTVSETECSTIALNYLTSHTYS